MFLAEADRRGAALHGKARINVRNGLHRIRTPRRRTGRQAHSVKAVTAGSAATGYKARNAENAADRPT